MGVKVTGSLLSVAYLQYICRQRCFCASNLRVSRVHMSNWKHEVAAGICHDNALYISKEMRVPSSDFVQSFLCQKRNRSRNQMFITAFEESRRGSLISCPVTVIGLTSSKGFNIVSCNNFTLGPKQGQLPKRPVFLTN